MAPEPAIPAVESAVENTICQLMIKLHDPAAKLPTRATPGSAGYDLYSCEDTLIPPGTRKPVNTGISIAVPPGTYARIAPRSGLSVKGLDIGAGVIDSDYRDLVKAVLINNSNTEFQIKQGDRMAQMILESIQNPDTQHVDSLPETTRGSSGFGSTGTSTATATTEPSDLGCNQPMVIPVTLQLTPGMPVPSSAMIDSGAST